MCADSVLGVNETHMNQQAFLVNEHNKTCPIKIIIVILPKIKHRMCDPSALLFNS